MNGLQDSSLELVNVLRQPLELFPQPLELCSILCGLLHSNTLLLSGNDALLLLACSVLFCISNLRSLTSRSLVGTSVLGC